MVALAQRFLDYENRVTEDTLTISERWSANYPLDMTPANDAIPEVRIIRTPGICGGSARFGNTRISVGIFIKTLHCGFSQDDVLADFPSLNKFDVQEAHQYYNAHRQEIDEDIASIYSLGESQKQELRAFFASLDEARTQPRKALRILFSFVDQALLDEKYLLCDSLLDQLEPSRLDVVCALGFLAITLPARDQLQRRAAYTRRLEEWLRKERPNDVEGLLAGLR